MSLFEVNHIRGYSDHMNINYVVTSNLFEIGFVVYNDIKEHNANCATKRQYYL